jgi:hypothetical protein
VFWVISVYFNIRNTLPKSGTFLLGHPVCNVICCESQGIKAKCSPCYKSEFYVTDYLQSAKLIVTNCTDFWCNWIVHFLCKVLIVHVCGYLWNPTTTLKLCSPVPLPVHFKLFWHCYSFSTWIGWGMQSCLKWWGISNSQVARISGTFATTGTHGLYSMLQEHLSSFDESCWYLDALRQVTAFLNGPPSTFFLFFCYLEWPGHGMYSVDVRDIYLVASPTFFFYWWYQILYWLWLMALYIGTAKRIFLLTMSMESSDDHIIPLTNWYAVFSPVLAPQVDFLIGWSRVALKRIKCAISCMISYVV